MGAYLTTEDATVQRQWFKVDTLGYLFCGDCLGFGRGGEPDYNDPRQASTDDPSEQCDGCHKTRAEWPVADVRVEVTVEHIPYKIF